MQRPSTLTAGELYFKTKRITRHKEEYFKTINEENITILTVHAPSNKASEHTKRKNDNIKGRNKSTVTVGDSSRRGGCYSTRRQNGREDINNTVRTPWPKQYLQVTEQLQKTPSLQVHMERSPH